VPLRKALRRVAALVLAALPTGALADGTPGDFDFYVLSLSWSPSYCESADRPDPEQCATGDKGFVVHGLWPQYERGYPDYCADTPRLPPSIVSSIADLMPRGLAEYQWRKHGVCAGIRPERYFELVRRAYGRIDIPDVYEPLEVDSRTSPQAIEQAFLAANPGMSERGIAVTCSRSGAVEVRICMTQRLDFRRCLEVDADACRARTITLPSMD
jgi:ribonuclease T2